MTPTSSQVAAYAAGLLTPPAVAGSALVLAAGARALAPTAHFVTTKRPDAIARVAATVAAAHRVRTFVAGETAVLVIRGVDLDRVRVAYALLKPAPRTFQFHPASAPTTEENTP